MGHGTLRVRRSWQWTKWTGNGPNRIGVTPSALCTIQALQDGQVGFNAFVLQVHGNLPCLRPALQVWGESVAAEAAKRLPRN